MSTQERLLRLVEQPVDAKSVVRALPRRAVSRRALYRVDTRSLDIDVDVRAGIITLRGRLLDVSAAGCCIELTAPLPSKLDKGGTATITLRADAHTLVCGGDIVSLGATGAGVEMRLRFRALAPQTHRALLAWMNTLVMGAFQKRHGKPSAVSRQQSAVSVLDIACNSSVIRNPTARKN